MDAGDRANGPPRSGSAGRSRRPGHRRAAGPGSSRGRPCRGAGPGVTDGYRYAAFSLPQVVGSAGTLSASMARMRPVCSSNWMAISVLGSVVVNEPL